MSRARKSAAAPILTILAIVLIPLGLYVGGYFLARESLTPGPGYTDDKIVRWYRYRWQAAIFAPAAKVEALLSGSEVVVVSTEDVREVIRNFGPP